MKYYTVTQEQMERLHGAAHAGAMIGGDIAYDACLKVEAILAEIAFKEGFDKSPGSAPEDDEPALSPVAARKLAEALEHSADNDSPEDRRKTMFSVARSLFEHSPL